MYARSEEFTRAVPECGDPIRLLKDPATSHVITNAVTSSPPSDSGSAKLVCIIAQETKRDPLVDQE